ncbi:4'-phosphopantetheinyl transferase superfamily protein [Chthonomonas calidirosea]|uniref:4'-phosphopantetheinyl transferase superfamily protein n=1 Tax=Chthonomonas calidirosea TaxID=454171 RepID=UPI0006EC9345|nr:4'-phosphopantetheinyl transferase superfamily protein [Chthonomonas calidirosea]CEK13663.1 phosphopantetheinyl transferase (holo-ACP synthase) [Chthonomonas calidirosea]
MITPDRLAELCKICRLETQLHTAAIRWLSHLRSPTTLVWLPETVGTDADALLLAAHFLGESLDGLSFTHDPLGKPYPARQGNPIPYLHISNTHDGGQRLLLAAKHENLAGVGLDVVYLPRLRSPHKDKTYLYRLAARFMGPLEFEQFQSAAQQDDEEALRRRVAAHFSLMEASAKALGTGLKIGAFMGHSASLPLPTIGALQIEPSVQLFFDGIAQTWLATLNVQRWEAYWGADDMYLVTGVFLFRADV